MQKLAAYVMLIVFLTCVQPRHSHAFAPAILAAGALGGFIVAAGAATSYKYYRPTSNPSNWRSSAMVTASGNIIRTIIGAQVVMNQYGVSVIEGNYLAAKANINALINQMSSDNLLATKYASLYAAFTKTPEITPPKKGLNEGDLMQLPSGDIVEITGVTGASLQGYQPGSWCSTSAGSVCTVWTVNTYMDNGTTQQDHYEIVPADAPTPRVMTQVEINEQYPFGEIVTPGVISDLDQMIADNANGYGISIVDAVYPADVDLAPPFIPPVTLPSPVDASAPSVTGLGSGTAAATGAKSSSAQTAAQTAQTAVNDYLSSHPGATAATDSALADLQSALDQAVKDAATAERIAADAKAAEEEIYPNTAVDELKTLNFDALKALRGPLAATFPFSLLGGLGSVYASMVADPVAPIFQLPLPLGGSITVDLAIFDPVATVCRYLIAVLLSVGIVYYIVRFWRGVA